MTRAGPTPAAICIRWGRSDIFCCSQEAACGRRKHSARKSTYFKIRRAHGRHMVLYPRPEFAFPSLFIRELQFNDRGAVFWQRVMTKADGRAQADDSHARKPSKSLQMFFEDRSIGKSVGNYSAPFRKTVQRDWDCVSISANGASRNPLTQHPSVPDIRNLLASTQAGTAPDKTGWPKTSSA